MLTLIRSLARSPLIGGSIIILLIAAFSLWGINDVFRGGGTSAIIVGPEHVTVQDLRHSYDRQLFQIQQNDPRFTREQAEEIGLGDSIVQRVIAETAGDAKADELGLSISDETLYEALEDISAFQNPFTNRFDPQTYTSILRGNGYSGALPERRFEAEMISQLRRVQFTSASLGGLHAPDLFSEIRQAYAGERRSFRALLIPPTLVDEPETPDDDTLQQFIMDNPQSFERAEQRRLTLVRIQASDLLSDIEVDEADMRELYEFRLSNGELSAPATRSLTQWLAADQVTAEEAATRLTDGEAADAVMAELGLGEGVKLTEVQSYQVPDAAVADAAFELGVGDIQAVEGRLGWRVVRIDAALDPEIASFEDLEDELREELAGETAADRVLDALGAFEEARDTGASLEEAAAASGLFAERLGAFTATGYTVDGEPLSAMLDNPDILQAAFAAPLGFPTDLTDFGENGYFTLRVDEVIEPRLADLDEVRAQAEASWHTQEIDTRLQALVDQAQELLTEGVDMDAVAAELGEDARVESTTLGRQETDESFTAQMVAQAFGVPEGQRFESRAGDQTTRAIVEVEEVIPGVIAELSDADRTALNAEINNDATQMLNTALMNAYKVKADDNLIGQALGRTNPVQ